MKTTKNTNNNNAATNNNNNNNNATKNTNKERNENTMKTAENILAAAARQPLAARIAEELNKAKTANTKNARAEAAENAAKYIKEYNDKSLAAAVSRCSFIKAAESVRLPAPKNPNARKNGVDYERRDNPVTYCFITEDGEQTTKTLTLPIYAREVFAANKATKEQKDKFAAALAAVERFQKNNVENDSHEGLKEAAAAITELVKACGLDVLTSKKAENGFISPFFVHRSFIHAAAARMKGNRGTYKTAAAVVNEAAAAAVNATEKNHSAAAARLVKAEAAAVKLIFTIINEAAAAAVVGVWNATVITADEAEAARKAREAEAARKAAAREAEKAAAAKEKERKAAEREALKKEREAKKAAAAKKAATAKKPTKAAAKKTPVKKAATAKKETPAA